MPKSKSSVEILERLFQKTMSEADWIKINRALESGKQARLGVSIYVTDRRESAYLAVQYKAVDDAEEGTSKVSR